MKEFLSYEDAKCVIQKAKLKSKLEFKNFNKGRSIVTKIPTCPDIYYSSEWINWNDFLNTNNKIACVSKNYISYEDAKCIIRDEIQSQHKLINGYAFKKFIKTKLFEKYKDLLPKDPKKYYIYHNNQWGNWDDFLQLSYINAVPYDELKTLFVKYKINDIDSLNYFMVHIVPELNIIVPRDIETTYTDRGEWIVWNDIFGLVNTNEMKLPSGKVVSINDSVNTLIDVIPMKFPDGTGLLSSMDIIKSPISLISRSIYDRNCKIHRLNDLTEAMIRYHNENREINQEWISEYKILMLELNVKEQLVPFINV